MATLYGGIEAGGTKFVCALGDADGHITEQRAIPTTTPEDTIERVVDFFKQQPKVTGVGIGSFGPIDLNVQSSTYGYITSTPKPNWANTDIVAPVSAALGVPVALDTDVNCAVLGEQLFGAARGLGSVAYMTVGTGIGVGCTLNGQTLLGLSHTETGHMLIPRLPNDPMSGSGCPFHENCLEGLAGGPALKKRWGKAAEELTDPAVWEMEAQYLAMGIANIILCLVPQRIVVGGGVMGHSSLLAAIRPHVQKVLNSYMRLPEITDSIEQYIVPPQLGNLSGVSGALALAARNARD